MEIIYRGYVIEWIPSRQDYRIYHISAPNWTVAYEDGPIEKIKSRIDEELSKGEV